MIDTPQIVQTDAQATAVIHLTIPRSEIQHAMGPAMAEVMATIRKQGIAADGPMFSHHFDITPETFDFEVGAPVKSPVTPEGRVIPSSLPSVRAARSIYRGPYEKLGAAWGELNDWIEQSGEKMAPGLWERYLKGPESGSDSSAWETELTHPLEG